MKTPKVSFADTREEIDQNGHRSFITEIPRYIPPHLRSNPTVSTVSESESEKQQLEIVVHTLENIPR